MLRAIGPAPQLIEAQQGGGGIRAAAAQPSALRDAFADLNIDPERTAGGRLQRPPLRGSTARFCSSRPGGGSTRRTTPVARQVSLTVSARLIGTNTLSSR